MECLSGYALKPYSNPAYSTAIGMAKQEISRLQRLLLNNYNIAQQHDVRYSIYRSPEHARIEELKSHIQRLESSTGGKSSSKSIKGGPVTRERSKRTKKVAMMTLSSKFASGAQANLGSSPISGEEDDDDAPMVFKRRKTNPEQSNLAPRPAHSSPAMSTMTSSAPIPELASLLSGRIPSLNPEDHLTLKKLKISHP